MEGASPDKGTPASAGERSILSAFAKYETVLKRYIARFFVNRHDVEDIVQEAFLRSFDSEKSQVIQSPKAFLFRTARNLALKELTRSSRKLTDYIEDLTSSEVLNDEPLADEYVSGRQKLAVFCQAVETLPAQCRKAFLLRKVYGLTHKEIAQELDISVSTVEKHLAKGLRRSSSFMQEHYDAEGGASVTELKIDERHERQNS